MNSNKVKYRNAIYAGPVDTILEKFVNLGVLFLTMWVSCCLSHNTPTCTHPSSVFSQSGNGEILVAIALMPDCYRIDLQDNHTEELYWNLNSIRFFAVQCSLLSYSEEVLHSVKISAQRRTSLSVHSIPKHFFLSRSSICPLSSSNHVKWPSGQNELKI